MVARECFRMTQVLIGNPMIIYIFLNGIQVERAGDWKMGKSPGNLGVDGGLGNTEASCIHPVSR